MTLLRDRRISGAGPGEARIERGRFRKLIHIKEGSAAGRHGHQSAPMEANLVGAPVPRGSVPWAGKNPTLVMRGRR
jgi:hypothetical protein